ncbi:hypothetical protein DFH29DRAFT_974378 [Suillus ampliporus]|nr:hypothetical protein DFH29DRAFT_974378 [Suillus ampliporus]
MYISFIRLISLFLTCQWPLMICSLCRSFLYLRWPERLDFHRHRWGSYPNLSFVSSTLPLRTRISRPVASIDKIAAASTRAAVPIL